MAAAWLIAPPEVPPPPIPGAYELSWTAPATCPGAAELRAQVARLAPELGPGDETMTVRGRVTATATGYALSIQTDFLGQTDRRDVESERCSDLAEATVLVIAIALVPELGRSDGKPPPRPTFGPGPGLVPDPDSDPPPRPAAPRESPTASSDPEAPPLWAEVEADPASDGPAPAPSVRPTAVAIRAAPMLEFGTRPRVGGATQLAAVVLWPNWRAELVGSYLWPQRGSGPPDVSAARFQMGSVGARGCFRARVGPVELPLCTGLDAGVFRTDSRGLSPATTLQFPWVAPVAAAGVGWSGRRVGFLVMPEVALVVSRSSIEVGGREVFRTRVVSGRLLAGLEIFFAIDPGRGGQRR